MSKKTNRERILAALIETSTIVKAAKVAGLGEATIYRYLQDADFVKEYRDARRQTVESAIARKKGDWPILDRKPVFAGFFVG